MAYSQDYIKRMIEQMGEFLLAIKNNTREERYDEALDGVNEAFKALLGMDSDFINSTPDDYLVLMTSLNSGGDASKCQMLADLLDAKAEVHEQRGEYEQSESLYLKALNVLTQVALQLAHKPMADHVERVQRFVEKLEDNESELPLRTKDRLFQFYERIGQFALAENMMYDMLNAAPDEEQEEAISEGGVAFYNRLLGYTDHELEEGGLPRTEVQEGLRELGE